MSARHLLAVAGGMLVATACAHEEHAYSFHAPEPPEVVLAAAQNQLQSQGVSTVQESPTRLVTPWEKVGQESVVQSTSSGRWVRVIEWQRFTIIAKPENGRTKVIVRQQNATCPTHLDRWSREFDECVRESTVTGKDQQAINRLGRNLQAQLSASAH